MEEKTLSGRGRIRAGGGGAGECAGVGQSEKTRAARFGNGVDRVRGAGKLRVEMEIASVARPSGRQQSLEVAGIFLVCLLLSGIRVALPEPPNPAREGRIEPVIAEADPEANRHYDRPADEVDYYAPVIRQMASRWPRIDLREDTFAEKPPGFPFLMATVARATGADFRWLRAVQMLLSAGVVAVLYVWVRRARAPGTALALVAPLVGSSFFIKSSSYLTTDNPTLLCTTIALSVLLAERRSTAGVFAVLVCATAAASFRQDALWLAAPIGVWLLLAGLARRWKSDGREATVSWPQRWLAVGAVALPLAIVARMVIEWGGLVPSAHVRGIPDPGFGFMPMVYVLSVAALFGWPWLIARHGARETLARATGGAAIACGAIGMVLAVATNSAYGRDVGHWGGYLWSGAALLPEVAGRSPLFLVLAPFGALALGAIGAEVWSHRPRAAAVLGAACAGWALAVCFNPLVFHRYYEAPLLSFLLLSAGVLPAAPVRANTWRDQLPLWAVSAGQLFITVTTLYLSLFAAWRR